jgi:hypothetical protein
VQTLAWLGARFKQSAGDPAIGRSRLLGEREHRMVGWVGQFSEVPVDGPTRLLLVGGQDGLSVLLMPVAIAIRLKTLTVNHGGLR